MTLRIYIAKLQHIAQLTSTVQLLHALFPVLICLSSSMSCASLTRRYNGPRGRSTLHSPSHTLASVANLADFAECFSAARTGLSLPEHCVSLNILSYLAPLSITFELSSLLNPTSLPVKPDSRSCSVFLSYSPCVPNCF